WPSGLGTARSRSCPSSTPSGASTASFPEPVFWRCSAPSGDAEHRQSRVGRNEAVPLVLGVDSSTQSTKVEVRDADTGELVAEGRAPHPPTNPPRSEQDPDAWLAALEVARAGLPDVDAIAVAGQQHGLVALDARGEVIRPAKLWNDTESAPDAQWLRGRLDDEGWARACGSVPVAAFTIPKLSWLH